jgi:hypothetical protein
MRWGAHVVHMEKIKNACKILVERPEGNISLGRPGHRWKNNIETGLGEIGWESMDWIHLAQDRDQWQALVNIVMNLWVP